MLLTTQEPYIITFSMPLAAAESGGRGASQLGAEANHGAPPTFNIVYISIYTEPGRQTAHKSVESPLADMRLVPLGPMAANPTRYGAQSGQLEAGNLAGCAKGYMARYFLLVPRHDRVGSPVYERWLESLPVRSSLVWLTTRLYALPRGPDLAAAAHAGDAMRCSSLGRGPSAPHQQAPTLSRKPSRGRRSSVGRHARAPQRCGVNTATMTGLQQARRGERHTRSGAVRRGQAAHFTYAWRHGARPGLSSRMQRRRIEQSKADQARATRRDSL